MGLADPPFATVADRIVAHGMSGALSAREFPAVSHQPLALRLCFLERQLSQDEQVTVRQLAVVQALTFPAVRLSVKPKLAIDLFAVLPERPDVLTGVWAVAAGLAGGAACTNRRRPFRRS